jgi:Polyketide cyclase / dehydrase and lipid transport
MPTHAIRPPEWIDTAPIHVEKIVDIVAPPAVVWAIIADHVAWPEWFSALDSVEVTGPPTGVGGTRRVTAKRLPLDEEFTAWVIDEHFAFAVVRSKLPFLDALAESVRIQSTDAGCRVIYRQGLQAKRGFGWLLAAIWKTAATQLADALVDLKSRAEARSA